MRFLAILVVLLGACGGIIFHVPANHEQCFGEELGFDMVVHGVWKLLSNNQAKLKVEVLQTQLDEDHPAPTKVVTKEGKDGSFGFTTEKQGEYRFCFHNEAPNVEHDAEVDFQLKVGFEAKDYNEVAKKEHLKPIEVELVKLHDQAAELLSELTHIRSREELHRVTTDNTQSALVGWSAISLVIIVVLGLYQTYYLRAYFKRKRLL